MSPSSSPLAEHLGAPIEEPDISGIVTEDGAPVDDVYSEKQMRLLTEPLYISWQGPPPHAEDPSPRPFLAAANVGLFSAVREPPLVPDVFLSVDVEVRQDLWGKGRSYFFWEYGKPPDVVIEVVSNREGDELGGKKRRYARMRIAHYVVWDPDHHLGERALRAFELRGDLFVEVDGPRFEAIGLELVVWEGTFESVPAAWLRWRKLGGELLTTGAEHKARAEAERERAEAERERAEAERERAEQAEAREAALREKLRALGVDPDAKP